jgi:hypothetical protein
MNVVVARRWLLKNRGLLDDAASGLGLIVFLATHYVVLP